MITIKKWGKYMGWTIEFEGDVANPLEIEYTDIRL